MWILKLQHSFFLNKSWFYQGLISVFLKLTATFFQLIALSYFCREVDQTIFSKFVLFQGIVSLLPYIDFGKGGLSLRKNLMEVSDEKVFFSRIWHIFLIYFVWWIIYVSVTREFIFGLFLFMRIPFSMQADAFYAYGENQLRAALDFVEALTLSILIFFLAHFGLDLFFSKLLYSAILFLNAVVAYFIFLKKRGWEAQNLLQYQSYRGIFTKIDLIHWIYTLVFSSYLVGFQWIVNTSYKGDQLFAFNAIFKLLSLCLGAFLILLNPLIHVLKKENVMKQASLKVLFLVIVIASSLLVFGNKSYCFFTGKTIQEPWLMYAMIFWMATTAYLFFIDHYLRLYHILLSVILMGTTYVLWGVFAYLVPSITTWISLSIVINLFSITIGSLYIRDHGLTPTF
jgi:hypothetical protein